MFVFPACQADLGSPKYLLKYEKMLDRELIERYINVSATNKRDFMFKR